jgi:hypothetical protein
MPTTDAILKSNQRRRQQPGTNNDLLSVGGVVARRTRQPTPGSATINGGTVDVMAAAGTYTDGTEYTFLGTSVTGR